MSENKENKGVTQMTNPPKTTKMVKIKAVTNIHVEGKTLAPGEIATVTKEEAEDFCKPYKKLKYSFGGERSSSDATRHEIVRAVRVTE